MMSLSADWFNTMSPGSDSQTAAKNKLRKGGAEALNVYTVGYVLLGLSLLFLLTRSLISFTEGGGQGLLGYATFPNDYEKNVSGCIRTSLHHANSFQ